MLYSIIIPAKNEENNIRLCLAALMKLKLESFQFEVLVVDNGSSDATISVVAEYGFKSYVKPSLSLSGLRNFGASVAAGNVLVFLDADCIPDVDWLKNATLALVDAEVGCTGSTPVAPANGTWVERIWSSFRTRRTNKCYTSWINSSNFIVRKELFVRVGGFNEKVKTCEDVDIGMRISKISKLLFDPSVKVVHLGEPKTLKDFFMKEVWRGKGTISGVISHGIVSSEMISLMLPLYYFVIPVGLIVATAFLLHEITLFLFLLYLLPPLVFSIWVIAKTGKVNYLAGYFVLFLIYANARTFALFIR